MRCVKLEETDSRHFNFKANNLETKAPEFDKK